MLKEFSTKINSIAMGGAVEKDTFSELLGKLKLKLGVTSLKIAVVCASRDSYNEAIEIYNDKNSTQSRHFFEECGHIPIFFPLTIDTITKENVDSCIQILKNVDIVFFQGGDQAKISRCFFNDDESDTEVLAELRRFCQNGGILVGTSAGDHIQSDPMIINGNSKQALKQVGFKKISIDKFDSTLDEESYVMKGFGIFSKYGLTDSHFDKRNRMGRLVSCILQTGRNLGIGVDEDTYIGLSQGKGIVGGKEGVFIVDVSNIKDYFAGCKLIKNIEISYLTDEDTFDFKTKSIITPKNIIDITDMQEEAYISPDIFSENGYEFTKMMTSLAKSKNNITSGTDIDSSIIYRLKKSTKTKIFEKNGKLCIEKMVLNIEIF